MTPATAPHVGTSMPRREDARFLRGEGRYVADEIEPGDGHVAVVRSPAAHGRIVSVDLAAARAAPGVIAVFGAADLSEIGTIAPLTEPDPRFVEAFGFSMAPVSLTCLARERVRYVGEPIAVVVAGSRATAEDAVELVDVDIDELDPVARAGAPGPDLYDAAPDNVAAVLGYEIGRPPDGPLHEVELDLVVGRHAGVPLETRGVRAVPTADGVRVSTSTQVPHLVRQAISAATGWESAAVVVAAPDVGGGFGTKANVYPEEVIIPVLARRLGRPVVWIEDRTEHFLAAAQGRDQRQHVRLAVDGQGLIATLEVDLEIDVGSGSLWTAGILANSAIHLLGPYRLPHAVVRGRARFSNKAPSAQYRGAGRPEACFALERALDTAADSLGLPRDEIRRRNLRGAEDLPVTLPLPYRDGVPITFDGGDWRACLDAAVEALPPAATAGIERRPGERLGWGVACYIEATGRGPFEGARVRLTTDGVMEVASGGTSTGQSHETVLAQVTADAAGFPIDRVRVVRTDTATVTRGVGTFASRTAILAGNAVRRAAHEVGFRLRRRLGLGERAVLEASDAGIDTGERVVPWAELTVPNVDESDRLDVETTFEPETVTWTMGAHTAIVAVDPATGGVRVVRYAVVHEGGIEINPAVVVGQVRGGVAQGIGGALLEFSRYGDDGQPAAVTLADYLLPTAPDVPRVTVTDRAVPTPANPLGVRGVGESGTIPAYAVIASAVDDALGGGPRVRATPISPAAVRALVAEEVGA